MAELFRANYHDMEINTNLAFTVGRRFLPGALLLVMVVIGGGLVFGSDRLKTIWQEITGYYLSPAGKPVPATNSKLSEHNTEWILKQPAQQQAEELMAAAINHDEGATELILQSLESWHGNLTRTARWQNLEMTALYSNDLRVRAAAMEIDLVANHLDKNDETVSRLINSAEDNEKSRPWTNWVLGMLANRGVQTEHIHEVLKKYTHDSDQQTRLWAVEGLAHIGTDDTIQDFLDVFRNDASLDVRERAGCSLAKSGMLTRAQRMMAVPGLLDLADDPSLDGTTRGWVYQALREITDEQISNDPAEWRNWYSAHGSEKAQKFRAAGSQVLGNS